MYKILTMLIILLSKWRSKCDNRDLRFDRTVELPEGSLFIECCDCGLKHFIVPNESATPVRPKKYDYKMRLGNVAVPSEDAGIVEKTIQKWFEYKGIKTGRQFYRLDTE